MPDKPIDPFEERRQKIDADFAQREAKALAMGGP